MKRRHLPVAVDFTQHDLRALPLQKGELRLLPLVGDAKAEAVAPEGEARRDAGDVEFGHQRRKAAGRTAAGSRRRVAFGA
ncbi:hypothetical protein D3C87_1923290 [compost metagenome]